MTEAVREEWRELNTIEDRLALAVSLAFHEGYRAGLRDRWRFRRKPDHESAVSYVMRLLRLIRAESVAVRKVSGTTEYTADCDADTTEQPK